MLKGDVVTEGTPDCPLKFKSTVAYQPLCLIMGHKITDTLAHTKIRDQCVCVCVCGARPA